MRNFLATVAGLVTAFLLIAAFQMVGHSIWPPPIGMDPTKPESIEAFMPLIPVGAMLFVALAHLMGGLIGSLVGYFVAKRNRIPGLIILGLVFAGSAANLMMISHPIWFMALDLGLIIIAFLLFLKFAKK